MTNWITSFNNEELGRPDGAIQLITRSFSKAAMALGFQELNYVTFDFVNYVNLERRLNVIDTILAPVQPGDTIFFQFPMYAAQRFSEDFMIQMMALEKVKKVAVVVDVPTWINSSSDDSYNAKEDGWLGWLRRFDLLIVANRHEAQHLHRDGVIVPMISMVLSDYLYRGPLRSKTFQKKLYYVTGRDVLDIDYRAATPINLFSAVAEPPVTENASLVWHGRQPSDAIMATLDGGFGIVTTDNLVERRGTHWRYYTRFNNPTKLSLYLAAGLPVITMSKTPHAALIEKRHLGLVVDDLNEIDHVLAKLDQTDYQRMLAAIVPWQTAVASGFFIQRALMAAIQTLDLGLKNQLTSDNGGDL
ncbi:hypothetical protein [Paucilactobacillus vaccinostercus]|nr:hypothetical protein [Paucilactobacillus vaccinostercus]